MAKIFKTALIRLWGETDNPFTFMQLLAANGGVPGMAALDTEPVSIVRRAQFAIDELAEEIHLMSYGYFDLLEDNGLMPTLKVARPANDNWPARMIRNLRAA